MREHKKVAVVMPVGPHDTEAALDTLASAVYYLDRSRVIVAVDDTSGFGDFGERAQELSPDIVVRPAPEEAAGGYGGLWVKIASGYQWVLDRYVPEVIVRLDTDALIIGAGIEERAAREFARSPDAGLLGSYRIGADGGARDWSEAARRLRAETGLRGLRAPARWAQLRELLQLAKANGYDPGEHALGGSYIHSRRAAANIHANGWFAVPSLASSLLGEDQIMALVTVAAGYRVADFGRPGDPMALRWKGLPSHPQDLLDGHKLVTHSVRSWGSLGEAEIRDIFRSARVLRRQPPQAVPDRLDEGREQAEPRAPLAPLQAVWALLADPPAFPARPGRAQAPAADVPVQEDPVVRHPQVREPVRGQARPAPRHRDVLHGDRFLGLVHVCHLVRRQRPEQEPAGRPQFPAADPAAAHDGGPGQEGDRGRRVEEHAQPLVEVLLRVRLLARGEPHAEIAPLFQVI
jgi:hypothetical protein